MHRKKKEARATFENSLQSAGLQLEYESKSVSTYLIDVPNLFPSIGKYYCHLASFAYHLRYKIWKNKSFQTSFDNKTQFLKIHAPPSVIQRNSEIIDLDPPVRQFYITYYTNENTNKSNNAKSKVQTEFQK